MFSQFHFCIFISVSICGLYKNTHANRFGSPAEWALQVLRNPSLDPPLLHDNEPGFDLNKEEMNKFHVWPMGIIPYYIDDLSFDKVLKDTIRLYLDNINKVTGLRFTEIPQPPEDEKSRWVFFINRKGLLGCADLPFHNFTSEGVQRVVLGYDCLAAGKMGAVVLSLIGVPPQHRAPDRFQFLKVVEKNILPDKLYLFEILKDDEWLFYDLKYDYFSVGHYGSHQYTSNGDETTLYNPQIRKARDLFEASGIGLTSTDLAKIRMLYNYIIRQRDTSVKVPGCDKLFAPGSNFSNFHPNISVKVEPRKKPNRYLLLPEEKINLDDEYENQNKTENQFSNENIEDNTLDTPSINQSHEDDIQIDVNQMPREKNIKLLAHTLSNKQKILKESDYETGDEGHKKYLYEKSK